MNIVCNDKDMIVMLITIEKNTTEYQDVKYKHPVDVCSPIFIEVPPKLRKDIWYLP